MRMGLYQCRGQITANSSDDNNYYIIIKSTSQFDCGKNKLNKHNANLGRQFPGSSSLDKTVFNLFMEVETPGNIRPPFYHLPVTPSLRWLPASLPILVTKKLKNRFDDFDTDPQYEWTFIISEVASNPDEYELKYIQLGPQGDDE